EVVVWKKGTEAPPAYDLEYLTPLFDELSEKDVNSPADIATALEQATQRAIQNWRTNQLTDAQAVFLDHLLEASLLSNRATNEKLKQLFTAYRELEEQVPIPTRVPGLLETDVVNQPLMVRGNHKQLNEEVPRHFLSAIEETPYDANDSGRLELAEDTVRPDNPFTSRVIVNRLWHYVFGAGLVRTPDNFGQLGEQPTHPELLDFLANRLREEGWSLKKMIRFMVTSETFQRSTDHTAQIHEQDPENRLWSHANLRRLEAEAIRDTLLAVSGQLDLKMYGPGYKPNSGAEQRSVYGYIQRNNLEKLLTTFDAPTPFATKGRRDVTNVPGQSLTLLNDPFIVDCATDWVRMLRKEYPDQSEKERIQLMFEQGLGRQPTEKEAQQAHVFLAQLGKEYTDLRADFVLLAQQERDVEKQIESILEPARKKLLPDQGNGEDLTGLPTPVAQWKFDEHADDELLGLKGKLNGSARLEEGALVLDGAGHLSSEAVPTRTMAKTLEAWVQLDNLDQQGGGVITLQRTDGYLFDSIVIGEIRPGHWIAGSNFHTRTLDFKGTPEADAVSNPVHIAISYDEQGNIQCFRNGVPYGESIRKASVQPFEADESNFLFGLRHAPAGGNRFLRGRIYEARFYDRALTAEELEVSSRSLGQFASPEKVRAELSAEQQTKLASYETKLKEIQKQRQSLGTEPKPEQAWIDLGHAIFNLKNFIYYE
ncbi:MAG: DUF1553 domain-containing protein, partial [Planctomycetaceae bacterium]|nr:DUF1553 domain-containing protein [Planctomycetaceae bacterium]